MAKCPVCKRSSGFYRAPGTVYPEKTVMTPVPLYQRSYPGLPGYISPRCGRCFDETAKRETRRDIRTNSGKSFQKTVPAVPVPVCKNCRDPLGAIAGLTDLDRLTEKVLGSCMKCLRSMDEYVATKLNAEPDRDNAIMVSGYALGLNAPLILAIPLKKRCTFWDRRPKHLALWRLEPIRP